MPVNNLNNSAYMGDKSIGAKAIAKEIRVLSTLEIYAMAEKFSKVTGLERNQFAINGWGFPFIPLPDFRQAYNNIRIAPKNVTAQFFGHPIYWIDPNLTARREKETEEQWCLRMFYLIDGFGYWTKNLEFIDFLKVNDFSFNPAQIEAYHRIADQQCITDEYTLLGTQALDISLDQVEENYLVARKKIFAIQDSESKRMLESQQKAYNFAKKAIGPKARRWSTSFDESGSVWARKFVPILEDIASEYNERSKKGEQMVSDLQKRARSVSDNLEKVIDRYNHNTSVMNIVVKGSIKGRPGGAARIAFLASSMAMANHQDNLRLTLLKPIDDAMANSFGSGNRGIGGFDAVIKEMEEVYSLTWNRLRLAMINFENLQNGEEIFPSVLAMESALQSESTDGRILNSTSPKSGSSSLMSALEQDFSQ